MKKTLFVNGSYNEIPLIKAAKKNGYYVITSGNDISGKGHMYSDEYVPCDYSNKYEILSLAEKLKVDVICSCGNDLGALSAAYAAEKLGLPGHDTYDVCRYFHEKDKFKELCNLLNLPTPKSFYYSNEDEAISSLEKSIFPLIIKPNDLGGGKGISIANNNKEAVEGIKNAFRVSKSKVILIEEYIQGEQYGFTCFIKNQKVVFNYLSRDFSYLNPFMVSSAIAAFQDEFVELRNEIVADIERMANAINMADGFLTIQIMVKNNKPYYLETMRRCLGNMHYICLSKDFGIDMYDLFVRNEFGLDTTKILAGKIEQKNASAFLGIYANKNGKYKKYSISNKYEKCLFDRYEVVDKDYYIKDYLHEKIGMTYFCFTNPKDRDNFINDRNNIITVALGD